MSIEITDDWVNDFGREIYGDQWELTHHDMPSWQANNIRRALTAAAPIIRAEKPFRVTVATSARKNGKIDSWVRALLDQAQGRNVEVTIIGSTDDEIRADERRRVADRIATFRKGHTDADDSWRSGMLAAERIAERGGE